jgi:hypothetical protein
LQQYHDAANALQERNLSNLTPHAVMLLVCACSTTTMQPSCCRSALFKLKHPDNLTLHPVALLFCAWVQQYNDAAKVLQEKGLRGPSRFMFWVDEGLIKT